MWSGKFLKINFIFNIETNCLKKKPYLTILIIPIIFLRKKHLFRRRCKICSTDAFYYLVVILYLYNKIYGYVFTVTFSPFFPHNRLEPSIIKFYFKLGKCIRVEEDNSGRGSIVYILYLHCFNTMKNIVKRMMCGTSSR